MDIFSIPILDNYLIYAPLHHLVTLVNRQAAQDIRSGLREEIPPPDAVRPIVQKLRAPGDAPPIARSGALTDPAFLGLITTRGCNLACRYCDFPAPKNTSPAMELGMARRALDGYFRRIQESGSHRVEVHFFGGEPFFAESVVHFAVEYSALRASPLGMKPTFEVATNGLFGADRCRWIADRFDTVVLSLDGPEDIQERQRPALSGGGTFKAIVQNAKILSEGTVDLAIRVCVSDATVDRMEEIAAWIAGEFRPSSVCFAPLTETSVSRPAGLCPPPAWEFARNFHRASGILERHGIKSILSTADLSRCRVSFCPVGKDAFIVSPDGSIDACYLFPEDWQAAGLNLRLGKVMPDGLEIDAGAAQSVRDLAAREKTLCADCLCRLHCAGGCHVRHDCSAPAGRYDDLCVQTRLITAGMLLRQLGQGELAEAWLQNRASMRTVALQKTDRLLDEDFRL
jgi:uncharacterized protein